MIKTTLKIEGMMCGMCETHICETIRKAVPGAKKVTASRSRKEASFLSEEDINKELLKQAIDATGYTCEEIVSEPYEKVSCSYDQITKKRKYIIAVKKVDKDGQKIISDKGDES